MIPQRRPGAALVRGVGTAAPSLRRLTPAASVLLVVAAATWVGIVAVANDMGGLGGVPGTMGLGLGPFVVLWALMMTAMMLPAVAPFGAAYSRTFRDGRGWRLAALTAGYLIVWSLAALPAYGLAWVAGWLVADHSTAATLLASAIFAACGAYQLTPVKDRCLTYCRSPLGFAMKYAGYHGRTRDLRVGLHHGAFCLACCWGLMIVLVALGLMNVAAMVVIAGVVLIEKTAPWGPGIGRALGVVALVLAVLVLFFPGLAPGLSHTGAPAMDMGGM